MITVERLITISINGPEAQTLRNVCELAKRYVATNAQSVTVLMEAGATVLPEATMVGPRQDAISAIVPGLTSTETRDVNAFILKIESLWGN
jgi:hypothetical protein